MRLFSKAAGEQNTAGVPSHGHLEDVFAPRTKLATAFSGRQNKKPPSLSPGTEA